MQKKFLKVVYILLLFLCINSVFTNLYFVYASDPLGQELTNQLGNTTDPTNTSSTVKKVIDTILVAVQVVGVGTALIMLGVLGAKYMIASPGDRAEIKKSAWVYFLGAAIIFGSTAIIKLIQTFSKV